MGGGVALCGQQDFQEQRPKKKKETNNNTKKYCSIFILFSEKKNRKLVNMIISYATLTCL